MSSGSSRGIRLAFFVFGCVALLVMVGGVVWGVGAAVFRAGQERTSATVVDLQPFRSCMRGGRTCTDTWRPVVTYDVAGHSYTITESGDADRQEHPIGSRNDVVYDPDDPGRAHFPRTPLRDFGGPVFLTIVGLGLAGFAFTVLRRLRG